MDEAAQANAAERRRWNDDYWASVWPKREQMTSAVTGVLLDRVGLRTGENVLDIGSGGGLTTLRAGALVGGRGSAVGADISGSLVELARERAVDRGAANVSFHVADVQQDTVPGMPFDVAMSQFGVMFFDEPISAFANIRRQMGPGGRLGFVCWQPVERNPWFIGPALAGLTAGLRWVRWRWSSLYGTGSPSNGREGHQWPTGGGKGGSGLRPRMSRPVGASVAESSSSCQ